MDRAFIAFGHGYERSERGRCTAFDGFDILAAPLGEPFCDADRERRIFRGIDGRTGCDYSSHTIKLAQRSGETGHADRRELFILVQHGGGREVLRLPAFYSGGLVDNRAALLALPERQLYALLYMFWSAAKNARLQAQGETRDEWARAYLDGRIRKKRQGGRISVRIESEFERDLRTGKAKPHAVSINVGTGEVTASPAMESEAA